MKVSELIGFLTGLPQEKEVALFWDGGARGGLEGIVNTGESVVLVGDWSIYRKGNMRVYPEDEIIYG